MIMTLIILVDQGSNALFVVPHVIQQERNQGTLGAMLVTPLTHFELLAGKFLGVWAYGLATSSFFLIPILFVAPNPILLGITVLLATAVLNLFGLLVGVIFTNEQMSRSFVSIFALPWTFSTYAGWLAIEGPWWVNALIKSLPTVQMGHAMLLSLTNDFRAAMAPLALLLLQLLVLLVVMAAILKRQENV
jgi:ABC-type transport system involved in multi-copper enzyme maturation permease subunit